MNDDGKAVAKVVAITRGVEQWQRLSLELGLQHRELGSS